MPHLSEHHETWIGRMLTDAAGHKIGKIDDIYTDDDTGQPEWLAVSTGLMDSSTHFVPIRGATVSGRGVQVPFPKDQVKVAPSAAADGSLSNMEKGRLYAHYGYNHAEERNRLQLSLGGFVPRLSPPVERLALSPPADLPIEVKPADELDVNGPGHRRDLAESAPASGRSESRGHWPDDEAIFGLSQDAVRPLPAARGHSRRR